MLPAHCFSPSALPQGGAVEQCLACTALPPEPSWELLCQVAGLDSLAARVTGWPGLAPPAAEGSSSQVLAVPGEGEVRAWAGRGGEGTGRRRAGTGN